MDVLGDAIRRERRSASPALRAPAVGRSYDYRRFCTSAWKVGNFLRHLGVRGGADVAIADDQLPEPVLSFYGAALLGGIVDFGPETGVGSEIRTLVVPERNLDRYETDPATKCVVYGDRPEDPSVSYFERDVWSENPTEPPDLLSPDDPLFRAANETHTHGDVLEAAATVVEAHSLGPKIEVAVVGAFTDPGVVAAGLVAPIVAGGTLVIGPGGDGDVLVGGPNSDVETTALLE